MLDWSDNDIIPEGNYTAKITAIIEATSKKTGNPMWVFTIALKECKSSVKHYQVVDGNLTHQAIEAVKTSLRKISTCFSIPAKLFTTAEWLNAAKIGRVHLYYDTKNDSTYTRLKFLPPDNPREDRAAVNAKPFSFEEGFSND